MNIIETIQFNKAGIVPAIAQDHKTGEILMMAWMNKEALSLSIERRQTVYYSRSRKKLWFKGEVSGHSQDIIEIFTDCDKDVILLTGGPLHNLGKALSNNDGFYVGKWVGQGGFAGEGVIPREKQMKKFLGKKSIATWNFNGCVLYYLLHLHC